VPLTSIDLKGDITRTLARTLPAVTGRPATVIRPFAGDAAAPAPLRLTTREPGVPPEAQALRIAMDIGAALNEPLSLPQVRVLAKLVLLCLELDAQQHDTPLTTLATWLANPAVLVQSAQRSTDAALRRFAATLHQSVSRATLASLAAKLDLFLFSPFLRRALEADDCIDFGAAFDTGELLLDLSCPAGTEEAAAILGALLLGRCIRSALSRPLGQATPATLLLDEVPEVIRAAHQREQLARLLALARARNVGCALNLQAGSQVDRQLLDIVRSCCGIEACFRLNLTDARAYAPAFPPPADAGNDNESRGALVRRLTTLQRREYLLWPKAWGLDPVVVRSPRLDFAALEAQADRVLAQYEPTPTPTLVPSVSPQEPIPEISVTPEVPDDSSDDSDFLHLG
jgi:hypothetical protein